MLDGVNRNILPHNVKAEYYALQGLFYYDLGDFNKDIHYTPDYVQKGNHFLDAALQLYPATSFEHATATGSGWGSGCNHSPGHRRTIEKYSQV